MDGGRLPEQGVFQHQSYRPFLRAVLAHRISKNPAYSLRSMASNLGMAPSSFSEVLNGRSGLSLQAANRVGRKLGLGDEEQEYFTLLVQLESAKSPELKDTLIRRIRQVHPSAEAQDVSVDLFQMMSEWYHAPLLMMTDTPAGLAGPRGVARRLGITTFEAQSAIERLVRLELLEVDANGRYRRRKSRMVARSPTPNAALRAFHRQMLALASASLESQTPDERVVGSETFAFDTDQLLQARRIVEQMFNRLVKLAGTGKKRDAVYHAGVQVFRLTGDPMRNDRSSS